MSPLFDFARKPALSTGSGRGIGPALAAGLETHGTRFVIGGCDAIGDHLRPGKVEKTATTMCLAIQSFFFVNGHKLHVDVGITSL